MGQFLMPKLWWYQFGPICFSQQLKIGLSSRHQDTRQNFTNLTYLDSVKVKEFFKETNITII